jgi:hypothetical protein
MSRTALFNVLIACIAKRTVFLTVQPLVRDRHIGRVGRRGLQRMGQTQRSIHPNVGLYPKVPRVTF